MKKWLVFDKETDSFDGKPVAPFIWGWKSSTGDEGITWSRGEFWDMIRNFDGIALAHNGGKFDIVLAADQYDKGEIKIINGRVAEVSVGKCKLRDSFLILPAPLKAAGQKDNFDYEILNRNKKHLRRKHAREIEDYLRQDCVALYNMVERFYETHGQRLTQAGAALACWEGMGGTPRRWGGVHDATFRQFYYGGRCQAFKRGALGDGWLYYDIKSSYPNAMQAEHTACHLNDYWIHNDITKITPQSFARIYARSKGCLPQRGKYATEYPHDSSPQFYFATGWEIIAGLETNTLEIIEAVIYRPSEHESLKPYTDKFYQDKLEAEKHGDSVGRLIAKIFLNSLYGKYGSNADEYKKYYLVDAGENKKACELYAEVGELDIVHRPDGGQFFDVALAASVTGYARAHLFKNMLTAKDVVYCDTDSIICKGGKFDIGENIGQWELENTLDNFHVAGKKLYAGQNQRGDWITAHKGFSGLDTDHANIIRAALGDTVMIERSAPSINVAGQQKFINRRMKRT